MESKTENMNPRVKPTLDYKLKVPHIIKYMGSKRELLGFIGDAINEIYEGEDICDLFAGTSVLSGSLGHCANMHSNDIQNYSNTLSKTYLGNYDLFETDEIIGKVITKAKIHVDTVKKLYPYLHFDYSSELSLDQFNFLEQRQQELIYENFHDVKNHLFIKNYSGTYWSFEQCLWIDGIRMAAENYSTKPVYNIILSSLMFSMAYNAQSTGHYAQYRNANNVASMKDIMIYRRKEIVPYFTKKIKELLSWSTSNTKHHKTTTLDYRDCLEVISNGALVYADPPYAFVHYSRFYHALETLILYDYPDVLFKGRYRTDRHQSPFCKSSEVTGAFKSLFLGIRNKRAKLILSYSNTGMISLEKILEIAKTVFGSTYNVSWKEQSYLHSTMGRSGDKSRGVKEILVIAKPC